MPTQNFYCECGFEEEVYIPITEELPKVCPACNNPSLKTRIGTFLFFDSTPKTVGTLAERNTIVEKTKVQEERAQLEQTNPILRHKAQAKANAPFWRPNTVGPDKSLARMTPEQQKRYILEGKK